MKRLIITILLITCLSACQKSYKVIDVIDGDTILVQPNQCVRIIGIDAPEIKQDSQKFKDDLEKYTVSENQELYNGNKSKNELKKRILNKKVTLIECPEYSQEVLENGRSGRDLRFVRISGDDIGKWMLQNGHARIWSNAHPHLGFHHPKENEYAKEEFIAKELNVGVWKKPDPEAEQEVK